MERTVSIFDLTDKVALITGSTRGIGRAIALQMAERGARVVVSSRKPEACAAVAAEIAAAGGTALPQPCNISHRPELQALVDAAIGKWGRIDILVCNAAVNPYYGPSLDISDEAFDKIMSSNVRSNFWLCNMVLPQMAARRGGAVIIVSSIGGLTGNSRLGVYCISKAADMQLARNIAVEWGPHNIRANCIAPGVIRTDFAKALWSDPRLHARLVRQTPLGRIGEPDDVAGAAVFLASRAGAFMSGQTLVIDGGGTISGSEVVGE
jgi:NAD(P)-dependent dehydrogenase (short-subunit alcohol dehydrogenase family)